MSDDQERMDHVVHVKAMQTQFPKRTTDELLICVFFAGMHSGMYWGLSTPEGTLAWEFGMAAIDEVLRRVPVMADYQI